MSATKEIVFEQEEKNQILPGSCALDPSKCSICMSPIETNITNTSGKCQTCLDKMNSVPTGFQFIIDGKDRKEFECPICLCILQNATELPCEHLMCLKCLEHYEKGQMERTKRDGEKETVFQCSICMKPYQPQNKYQVKSTDRLIQTTITVKCLQQQCDWTGCIIDYQAHDKKCDYAVIECLYYDLGCLSNIERRQLPKHNRANQHLHDSLLLTTVNILTRERHNQHQIITKQSQEIDGLRRALIKTNKRIGNMEVINEKLTDKIDSQDKIIDGNATMIDQLAKRDSERTTTMQNLSVSTKTSSQKNVKFEKDLDSFKDGFTALESANQELLDEINTLKSKTGELEKSLKRQSTDVTNLILFADHVSHLHTTLSDPWIRGNKCTQKFLYQEDYDQSQEIREWNAFVKKLKSEIYYGMECDYLFALRHAVFKYESTVYCQDWGSRLSRMSNSMESAKFNGKFIKFWFHRFERISVTIFNIVELFNSGTKGWMKHSNRVATFHSSRDPKCLLVAFSLRRPVQTIWVLHSRKEDMRKELSLSGDKVTLDKNFLISGEIVLQIEQE